MGHMMMRGNNALVRLDDALPAARNDKVDERRGASGDGSASPRFVAVDRVCPHERHLQVDVRVDASRNHELAGGIELPCARRCDHGRADIGDDAIAHDNVGACRAVRIPRHRRRRT